MPYWEPNAISDAEAILHLLGGALMLLADCNIFVGKRGARVVAIGVATIVILGALVSINAYPVWAVGLIVLNIAIIWALLDHGTEITLSEHATAQATHR
jgi:hypothetical protein